MKKTSRALNSKKNSRFEDEDESFDFEEEDYEEQEAMERAKLGSDAGAHTYALIEILSPTQIKEHCYFYQEYKPGTLIFVSYPILLVMDELCTKQFLLSGKQKFK